MFFWFDPFCRTGRLHTLGSHDRVIERQHDDGTDDRDEQAPQVEAGYPGRADRGKNPSSDDATDDPEHDVSEQSLARFVDEHAADPAGDRAEYDPTQDTHRSLLTCALRRSVIPSRQL